MLDGSKFSKYLKMAMKSVNPKLDAIHRRKKKCVLGLIMSSFPLSKISKWGLLFASDSVSELLNTWWLRNSQGK